MFNFADATEKALAAGAAVEVADAPAPSQRSRRYSGCRAAARCMGCRASLHAAHRGADRLSTWLAPWIDAAIAERRGWPNRQPLSWRLNLRCPDRTARRPRI
jgi:hypothetical protein